MVVIAGLGTALTYVTPVNRVAIFVFIGASMLLAAARGYDGCELLAVPNLVLRRRNAIWCPIYTPIDAAEGARPSSLCAGRGRSRHPPATLGAALAGHGLGQHRSPGRLTLSFHPAQAVQLAKLVAAERQCCGHLTWTLDLGEERAAVVVEGRDDDLDALLTMGADAEGVALSRGGRQHAP